MSQYCQYKKDEASLPKVNLFKSNKLLQVPYRNTTKRKFYLKSYNYEIDIIE